MPDGVAILRFLDLASSARAPANMAQVMLVNTGQSDRGHRRQPDAPAEVRVHEGKAGSTRDYQNRGFVPNKLIESYCCKPGAPGYAGLGGEHGMESATGDTTPSLEVASLEYSRPPARADLVDAAE